MAMGSNLAGALEFFISLACRTVLDASRPCMQLYKFDSVKQRCFLLRQNDNINMQHIIIKMNKFEQS